MELKGDERQAAINAILDELDAILAAIGAVIPGATPDDLRRFKLALQNLDVAFRALLQMDFISDEPARPRLVSLPKEE
jgi:enamine deaminase RidA (YjgF/YER057c/UK114 family)